MAQATGFQAGSIYKIAILVGIPCLAIENALDESQTGCCAAFQVTDLTKAEQALNDLGVEYHK